LPLQSVCRKIPGRKSLQINTLCCQQTRKENKNVCIEHVAVNEPVRSRKHFVKALNVQSIFLRHVLVKAPPWSQYEKKARGHGRGLIQQEAKPSGLEIHATVLYTFHIALAWWCFNWFKAFLVDKYVVHFGYFYQFKILRTWPTVLYFPYTVLYFLKTAVWKI